MGTGAPTGSHGALPLRLRGSACEVTGGRCRVTREEVDAIAVPDGTARSAAQTGRSSGTSSLKRLRWKTIASASGMLSIESTSSSTTSWSPARTWS